MLAGYNGKVLFVDLTSGSIKEESLPQKIYRDFIGGYGLGVRILYERMKPKTDPLGPDNILGFVVGPLTGIGVDARFFVVAKSPLTGGWGDSNSGGSFSAELRAAGYDGVFFSGISPKPVYLFLHDGWAELKNASHLWGKDTVETEDSLKNEPGLKGAKVACIGPAGEARSLSAGIMHEGSAAARSGLGAVMGAKRLKAFAVRGTKKVPLADPEHLTALHRDFFKSVRETELPQAISLKKWGTAGGLSTQVVSYNAPVKNWTLSGEEAFPNHAKICGDEVTKYLVRKHTCSGCPAACKGWLNVDKGPYTVFNSRKPEYETLALFGPNLLIDNVEAIIKANDLCNRYGLDTMNIGETISFAMECYEKGVITKKDTDAIELTWGNGDGLIAMVEKIGQREGFGAVLADGSKRAAERIGKGSEEWAINVGGQDLAAHNPTVKLDKAWGYVCDPAPGRHTVTQFMANYLADSPFFLHFKLELPKPDPLDIEANAPIYATCGDLDRLWVAAGLCRFGVWIQTFPLLEAISAITGWDFTLDEGLKVGRRIQTLRQEFNIREGVNTSQWTLPERFRGVVRAGPFAGKKIDFKTMKEKGYEALGWDAKTGKPLESTLEELGLKELVGLLP